MGRRVGRVRKIAGWLLAASRPLGFGMQDAHRVEPESPEEASGFSAWAEPLWLPWPQASDSHLQGHGRGVSLAPCPAALCPPWHVFAAICPQAQNSRRPRPYFCTPATTPYLGNTKLSSSHGLKLQPHPDSGLLATTPCHPPEDLESPEISWWASPQGSKGQCFYWLFPEGIGIQSHQIFRHFREGLNSRFFFMWKFSVSKYWIKTKNFLTLVEPEKLHVTNVVQALLMVMAAIGRCLLLDPTNHHLALHGCGNCLLLSLTWEERPPRWRAACHCLCSLLVL